MRFYDPTHPQADSTGFRCFSKPYGRSLTTSEDVKGAFRTYFTGGLAAAATVDETSSYSDAKTNGEINGSTNSPTNGVKKTAQQQHQQQQEPPEIRIRSISSLLVHLRPLIRWFEENKSLRFYASSLLIVYEGDMTADIDMSSIKMIDFGRVRREAGGDSGYMHGLTTLKTIFTELLEEETTRIKEQQPPQPT